MLSLSLIYIIKMYGCPSLMTRHKGISNMSGWILILNNKSCIHTFSLDPYRRRNVFLSHIFQMIYSKCTFCLPTQTVFSNLVHIFSYLHPSSGSFSSIRPGSFVRLTTDGKRKAALKKPGVKCRKK